MISIRNSMALGALALAAGFVGTQAAWAQTGGTATTSSSTTSMVSLLSIGTAAPSVTITPAVTTAPLGRGPVSQPIPGPIINN